MTTASMLKASSLLMTDSELIKATSLWNIREGDDEDEKSLCSQGSWIDLQPRIQNPEVECFPPNGMDDEDESNSAMKATSLVSGDSSSTLWNNIREHDDENRSVDGGLDFQPRLQDPDEPLEDNISHLLSDTAEEEMMKKKKDVDFKEDAAVRPSKDDSVEKCFEKIQLVSPKYFESDGETLEKREDPAPPFSSSLSTMIHPMDLDLFLTKPDSITLMKNRQSDDSLADSISVSSCPACTSSSTSSVLQIDQYTIIHDDEKKKSSSFSSNSRSRLSSSFRSSVRGNNRITYSLSAGRRGMSKKDRLYSHSFLPHSALLKMHQQQQHPAATESTASASSGTTMSHGSMTSSSSTTTTSSSSSNILLRRGESSLSILLVHTVLKIFEVVSVEVCPDTTVGDALAKARTCASDQVLAEQKYCSLCNHQQELAAFQLPVHLIMMTSNNSSKSTVSSSEQQQQQHLLSAVPEGSTAAQVRAIQRILWKTPRMQRWWKQQDPFQPNNNNNKTKSRNDDNGNKKKG